MSNEVLNINQRDNNGKRHGYWEFYWLNGKLMKKGNYINGKRKGYWQYFGDYIKNYRYYL